MRVLENSPSNHGLVGNDEGEVGKSSIQRGTIYKITVQSMNKFFVVYDGTGDPVL